MAARCYPLFQIFDVSGNPLTGGTVYAYEAGTTTPKLIYPTKADALANTNGAVSKTLPLNGSIIIWFNDTTLLKLVIKDADDVVISNGTLDTLSGEYEFSETTLTISGALDLAYSTPITADSTTDLSGATGNTVDIYGTTAITSFGIVAAGAERILRFQNSLTLTYNATSLILPGSSDINTAAGDVARFISLGSGNWFCANYTRKSGENLTDSLGSVTAAATTDLGSILGNVILVTGSTTITSLGTANEGILKTLVIVDGLVITYNASTLITEILDDLQLPSGSVVKFLSTGAGTWTQLTEGRLLQQLNQFSSNISSASTTDLATATGDTVQITGTTTISSFGTLPAGIKKRLVFQGSLTVTYNGTSLITPSASNIGTNAGSIMDVISLGSGNWQVLWYSDVNEITRATQSDVEGGSNARFVTPAFMQYHQSAAKAWGKATAASTSGGTYNVSGISHPGTGLNVFTYSVGMSSTNHTIVATVLCNAPTGARNFFGVNAYSTSSVTVHSVDSAGTATDPYPVTFAAYGDL